MDLIEVARERWSRLRLKRVSKCAHLDSRSGGKGAVVSPEIETCLSGIASTPRHDVARERWSRLRLKHQNGNPISVSGGWQGSGGLA